MSISSSNDNKSEPKQASEYVEKVRKGMRESAKAKQEVLGGRTRMENKTKVIKGVLKKRKLPDRKPSQRMVRAVNNMVENGGNVSKAMRDGGYSPATAKNPGKLTNSKGFKLLCKDLGLTKTLFATSLRDDVIGKPGFRIQELNLMAKVLGLVKASSTNVSVKIANVELDKSRADNIIDIL